MMERHRRVHRLHRVLRIVQRHLDGRARPVHREGIRAGIRIGIPLHRLLIIGRAVGFGGQFLPGVAGDLLIAPLIHMMERHRRVHRLRRVLHIVQRHLDGRARPVRREALRLGVRIGIPLHLRLVGRGIGLHARGRFRRGVAGDLLTGLPVQMVDRHRRVHRLRRVLHIVQRHLDGRARPVRREALRLGVRIGIPLHLRLVGRGIGLHARGRFRRGVAGDLLTGLPVQMVDRHRRVHRFHRVLHIVQRHLDGRTRPVHREGIGAGIRIGIPLHRLLITGRAVGFGGQLLPGVVGDLLTAPIIHMMERHRRVHHLRFALPYLKHHGIGGGGAVLIERHKNLAGADELIAPGNQRQVGREAPPLGRDNVLIAVKLLAAFIAVGDIDRAAGGPGRLVGRDGNGGKVERIGDLEHAAAVHLDARGNRAVHRRGVARQQRSSRGAVSNQLRVLGAGDALDAHARLHRLLGHGGPIDHLVSVERGRDRHALYASVRRAPLDGHGGKHADILRQRGQRQNHLRRDEQQAGQKRRGASEGFRNMLCHMRNPPYAG